MSASCQPNPKVYFEFDTLFQKYSFVHEDVISLQAQVPENQAHRHYQRFSLDAISDPYQPMFDMIFDIQITAPQGVEIKEIILQCSGHILASSNSATSNISLADFTRTAPCVLTLWGSREILVLLDQPTNEPCTLTFGAAKMDENFWLDKEWRNKIRAADEEQDFTDDNEDSKKPTPPHLLVQNHRYALFGKADNIWTMCRTSMSPLFARKTASISQQHPEMFVGETWGLTTLDPIIFGYSEAVVQDTAAQM